MMQSILSMASANTSALEANSEASTAKSTEQSKHVEVKEGVSFSEILDNLSAEAKIDSQEQQALDGESIEEFDSESIEEFDRNSIEVLESESLDLASTVEQQDSFDVVTSEPAELASTIGENDLQTTQSQSTPLMMGTDLDALSVEADSTTESADSAPQQPTLESSLFPIAPEMQEQEVDMTPAEYGQNPILAQIELAQKTDTKVAEVTSDSTDESFELDLQASKATAKGATQFLEQGKLSVENGLDQETGATSKLSLQQGLSDNNKLDSIIASLKPDSERAMSVQSDDSNELASITQTTLSADKLAAKTQGALNLAPSTPLQEPIPLQSKQASALMGEKIKMMINQGKQEVTIRLDPAELGSMQIKLHVQQDQLQVAIQTQVGQSRDIIEQHLPRLREQLEQQGINLGEATVEQQSKQDQSQSQHAQHADGARGSLTGQDSALDEQSEWLSAQIASPTQGIDYYA